MIFVWDSLFNYSFPLPILLYVELLTSGLFQMGDVLFSFKKGGSTDVSDNFSYSVL